jgi:hypothetical protein
VGEPAPGTTAGAPGRRHVVTRPTDGTVEAWSTVRLPFEPRGWLADLRGDLGHAVRSLTGAAGAGHHLAATYTSVDRYRVDAENVLLYNVGTACFGRPAVLRVERRFEAPPDPPVPLDGEGLHHHRYSLGADLLAGAWTTAALAAHWDTGPLPAPGHLASAATIWAAVRSARPAGLLELRAPEVFGMEMTVTAPDGARRSLPALTKVLLDGCIAALHDHDGTDRDQIASRLAVKAGLDRATVIGLLEPVGAVLGPRRLLHRFGAGVQWNPADDRCVSALLRLEAGNQYRIAGRLLAVVGT